MKASLVFPPFYLRSLYNLPPLGLVSLGTALRDAGHDAVIHDFVLRLRQGDIPANESIYQTCARSVLADGSPVVGISAQCATYPPALRLAAEIKRCSPETVIVAGGHNASFVDAATLEKHPQVDMVARGEGESLFPELLDVLESCGDLASVRGLTWRDSGGSVRVNPDRELIPDLDALPHPDHALAPPLAEYKQACGLDRSIAILEVGRGCPHHCAYCSESVLWRRRVRTYSPPRLVREMRRLAEAGAESFLLSYDQFTARRPFVEEFCQLVIDEGLAELPWHGISRLDTVDAGLLELMRRSGCASLCYGIDSGSNKTLAYIRKRIDEDLLFDRVRETTEQGITPTLSFIVGFPEEEAEDVDATINLALRCAVAGDVNPLVQLPTVLPGADLHAWTRDRLTRQVDTYFSLGLEYDGRRRLASDEALIDSDPDMFSSFYNPPCAGFDLKDLDRIASILPTLMAVFPKTLLLLTRALGRGGSELVLDFLARLDGSTDLAATFRTWALERFEQAAPATCAHLPEVMAYETCAVQAARGEAAPPERIPRGPWLPAGVVAREFAVDMERVVADLRSGLVRETYPEAPCSLVFLCDHRGLDVSALNPFGRDMLALCDGENSARDIAKSLFERYPESMSPEAFEAECRKALDQMAGLGFVRSGLATRGANAP